MTFKTILDERACQMLVRAKSDCADIVGAAHLLYHAVDIHDVTRDHEVQRIRESLASLTKAVEAYEEALAEEAAETERHRAELAAGA